MLKNLKIKKKLLMAFITVALLASIAGVVSIAVMGKIDNDYTDTLEYYGFAQGDVAKALSTFCRIDGNVHDAVGYQNQNDKNAAISNVQTQSAGMSALIGEVEASLLDSEPELKTKLSEAKTAWDSYQIKADELIEKSKYSSITLVQQQMVKELDPLYLTIYSTFDDILTSKIAIGNQESDGLTVFARNITLFAAALVIFAFVVSILLGIYVAKGISGTVVACTERLKKLALGDLQSPVPEVAKRDETGELADATKTIVVGLTNVVEDLIYVLQAMAAGNFDIKTKAEANYIGDFEPLLYAAKDINTKLSDTLTQINQAAEQVSNGSDQVSSGAQALSQGATQQASSVEELAATINDISSQVKVNADSAKEANEIVANTADELSQSNEKMKALISAMDEISKSSQEIGKVIKTIEDIAFQTNILALNAAVEAARAGAAGKGFAVVADEVRSLASKSSEAAKGTTALIENSIRAVENGTNLADETAKSLVRVVDGAGKVAETVDQIVVASDSQASSITQVTVGVDQISSVVQTNSATAEESAAASEELSGQAQMLKDLVGKFRLKHEESTVAYIATQSKPNPVPISKVHSALNKY